MEIKRGTIDFLGHAGFLITLGSNGNIKKIAIDPYNVSPSIEKVDFILITHSHYDHCSIKDIQKLSKEGTVIVCPPDVQSKITRIENIKMELIEAGDELEFGKIKIEALSAYNINKEFHTKKDGWIGFLIKFENTIIYHAGDTDKIEEMERLTGYGKHGNEFIALLPVSGKYVMTAEEAAEAASFIGADITIPMHYGSGIAGTIEDAERFLKLCREIKVEARVLEKI